MMMTLARLSFYMALFALCVARSHAYSSALNPLVPNDTPLKFTFEWEQ
jgi:hypothetical protein